MTVDSVTKQLIVLLSVESRYSSEGGSVILACRVSEEAIVDVTVLAHRGQNFSAVIC